MLLYSEKKNQNIPVNLYQTFFNVFFIKRMTPKIDTLVCPDW